MMNFFIVPGNTRLNLPKKELESLLNDKTEPQDGDFIFSHNRMKNVIRYFSMEGFMDKRGHNGNMPFSLVA
jgi:hypothetical protein